MAGTTLVVIMEMAPARVTITMDKAVEMIIRAEAMATEMVVIIPVMMMAAMVARGVTTDMAMATRMPLETVATIIMERIRTIVVKAIVEMARVEITTPGERLTG